MGSRAAVLLSKERHQAAGEEGGGHAWNAGGVWVGEQRHAEPEHDMAELPARQAVGRLITCTLENADSRAKERVQEETGQGRGIRGARNERRRGWRLLRASSTASSSGVAGGVRSKRESSPPGGASARAASSGWRGGGTCVGRRPRRTSCDDASACSSVSARMQSVWSDAPSRRLSARRVASAGSRVSARSTAARPMCGQPDPPPVPSQPPPTASEPPGAHASSSASADVAVAGMEPSGAAPSLRAREARISLRRGAGGTDSSALPGLSDEPEWAGQGSTAPPRSRLPASMRPGAAAHASARTASRSSRRQARVRATTASGGIMRLYSSAHALPAGVAPDGRSNAATTAGCSGADSPACASRAALAAASAGRERSGSAKVVAAAASSSSEKSSRASTRRRAARGAGAARNAARRSTCSA
eukprot:scaffold12676_cov112-Isochrysis_galbana.AAC.5